MLQLECQSIVHRLCHDDPFERAIQIILDCKWREIGSGSFSVAYVSPDRTRVVKIGSPDGGTWAAIAAFMADPLNPHFPKIYGVRALSRGWVAIEMEILMPMDPYEFGEFEEDWDPDWNDIRDRPGELGLAFALVNEAVNQYEGVDWDIHEGNVYVRPSDGREVLLDPAYEVRRHMGSIQDRETYRSVSRTLRKARLAA